jgi:hypothetical protein
VFYGCDNLNRNSLVANWQAPPGGVPLVKIDCDVRPALSGSDSHAGRDRNPPRTKQSNYFEL